MVLIRASTLSKETSEKSLGNKSKHLDFLDLDCRRRRNPYGVILAYYDLPSPAKTALHVINLSGKRKVLDWTSRGFHLNPPAAITVDEDDQFQHPYYADFRGAE